MPTIDIFADTRGTARCRGCDALIEWATVVKTGKKMPFNARIVVYQTWTHTSGRPISRVELSNNHWATCPARGEFSRR